MQFNEKTSELIEQICREHGIILEDMEEYTHPEDVFDGKWEEYSCLVGEKIYLGIYKDVQKKLISFFHELGHRLVPDWYRKNYKSVLLFELKCWDFGIEYALRHGIEFEDDTVKWGYEQALTYTNYS